MRPRRKSAKRGGGGERAERELRGAVDTIDKHASGLEVDAGGTPREALGVGIAEPGGHGDGGGAHQRPGGGRGEADDRSPGVDAERDRRRVGRVSGPIDDPRLDSMRPVAEGEGAQQGDGCPGCSRRKRSRPFDAVHPQLGQRRIYPAPLIVVEQHDGGRATADERARLRLIDLNRRRHGVDHEPDRDLGFVSSEVAHHCAQSVGTVCKSGQELPSRVHGAGHQLSGDVDVGLHRILRKKPHVYRGNVDP